MKKKAKKISKTEKNILVGVFAVGTLDALNKQRLTKVS
jgi:hypothetical protein